MVPEDAEPEAAGPVGLTVAQMAKATGVTGYTLRYYERAGLIHPIHRTSGNQRRYQPDDVEWVRFLVRLRETGMPIDQIREYATLRAQGESAREEQLAMLAGHQRTVRRQIKRLRAHERALTSWIEDQRRTDAPTDDE